MSFSTSQIFSIPQISLSISKFQEHHVKFNLLTNCLVYFPQLQHIIVIAKLQFHEITTKQMRKCLKMNYIHIIPISLQPEYRLLPL